MSVVNLKSLIQRLNPSCQRSLEAAVGMCLSRSHYSVEIAHWLLKLIEVDKGDLTYILPHYQIDPHRLITEVQVSLETLKTGNSQPPVLSQWVVDWIRESWLIASLEFEANAIRSGYLLCCLLQNNSLNQLVINNLPQLKKINLADLQTNFNNITKDSSETVQLTSEPTAQTQAIAAKNSKTPALDQFTIDLTAQAKAGKIDEVIGRDAEIRQIIDILMRRRQNNPILTGEPGVGKTAVVEGFALRIARKEVPPALQPVKVLTLDLGLLQAGAGIKGEFENRLKNVIAEVKNSAQPIILFIDEAHTMVGAGAQAGQGDAANLLKPALARGELRTIAATTWTEYKKYFEQDAALARRFQVIKVEEPDEVKAITMLRGLVSAMEKHHNVRILDEAIHAAVQLTNRYISGRQLPDKAISALDTASSRLAIRATTNPPVMEDLQRQLELLATEIALLGREQAIGSNHKAKLTELLKKQKQFKAELTKLQERWTQEKELIEAMRDARLELEQALQTDDGSQLPNTQLKTLQSQLQKHTKRLQKLQGETPLLQACVNAQTVAEVIAAWTGIPLGRMNSGDIKSVSTLQQRLANRVVGQPYALQVVSQRIQVAKAQLSDPRKPIGVFLFVGPSGVGKTETALALAEQLYGGEQNLTVINLSEFKEEHKVSLLLGSPPGYVGYGEGGVLTEAVRRKPYSLVLLDEVEKAHSGVQDIFYQVFDKGMLKDGQGRDIDFKNTVIILTSNVGSDLISKVCADPDTMPEINELIEMLKPELLKVFKPAFLGRVSIIPYLGLNEAIIKQIIHLQLTRIQQQVAKNHKADLFFDEAVIDFIATQCLDSDAGARDIEQLLTVRLLPELSARFLDSLAEGKVIKQIVVDIDKAQQFRYEIN